jgi:ubiquitin thioesterase ZRANB1
MQASWGVFDRDNILRRALSDSLHQCGNLFYPRWKEYEMLQAALLHFALEEAQWEDDWSTLLSLASQPGASLEQLHIFVLAHIFRRPIIVYGVKYVKSFRGEDIGYARFEGELRWI